MRTSLNEIKFIDDYVSGNLDSHQQALANSRQQNDPVFMIGVLLHKKILRLIAFYHRDQLKGKLVALHDKIMTDPDNTAYRAKLNNIFKEKKP